MSVMGSSVIACVAALVCAGAVAFARTNSAAAAPKPNAAPAKKTAQKTVSTRQLCHALEQDAAANGLPAKFFARVIWQESEFNARAVSPKGAEGIAQFMPATAQFRGLDDPFDPIASLKNAADYLGELQNEFGNLGLAAAGYNAGPGRVQAWLDGKRTLPDETRDYVATITGWTAGQWASASPPKLAETTIPQGVPCARLAELILPPANQHKQTIVRVPLWGAQLTANWSEARAWATYRILQRRFAGLIGGREPIVLRGRFPGLGRAVRYMIRIGGDSRPHLEKLCNKLIAAGGACVVLRNARSVAVSAPAPGG